MTSVKVSIDLPASAHAVWAAIRDYHGLHTWHPLVARSENVTQDGDGAPMRRLTLHNGAVVVERLEDQDDESRTYSYAIIESPLPVKNYVARLTVRERGQACTVDWSSEFEPQGAPESEAIEIIQGVYQAGFGSLRTRFGG